MHTHISQLEETDRFDLERRLALYGLTGEQHTGGSLSVPAHASVILSAATQDQGRHYQLTTESIDQVKAWIGVPDAVFQDTPCEIPVPEKTVSLAKSQQELDEEDYQLLHDAVRAYIWGDSSKVANHKPMLEKFIFQAEQLQITTHIYLTLDVKGKISFPEQESTVIILANTINFYPDGEIISPYAQLKISATNIYHPNN